MSENTKKIKIYAKLFGIGLIFLIILAFVIQNRNDVSVKFLFWQTPELPMFIFVIAAANCGIVLFLIGRKIRGVFRDFKQMRQNEKKDIK